MDWEWTKEWRWDKEKKQVCDFCGCLYTLTYPCDCIDVEVDNLINDLQGRDELANRIKQFTPQRKKMDEQLDQDRFNLFYKRIRDTFEMLYRFLFFCIAAFFAINIVLLMMCMTFIFLLLTINHVLVPLARTAGLY